MKDEQAPETTSARGAAVEQAARVYLEQAELCCLESNVRFRVGELDLVMFDSPANSIVFVEVRYRRNLHFGGGASSVDKRKCQKLIKAAQLWLANNPLYAQTPCRFDVVEASGQPLQLNWISNAFDVNDLS